jgi:hypothetical protein
MKNTIKFIGIVAFIAIIGFTMAGCGDLPSTDGELTIKGIDSKYNGKYIAVFGESETTSIMGIANLSGKNKNDAEFTFVKISGGQAKVPLYKVTDKAGESDELSEWFEAFDESKDVILGVLIFNDGKMKYDEEDFEPEDGKGFSVKLTSGKGEVDWKNGTADIF